MLPIILATTVDVEAELLITGGDKQWEEEWKDVTEVEVLTLSDSTRILKASFGEKRSLIRMAVEGYVSK